MNVKSAAPGSESSLPRSPRVASNPRYNANSVQNELIDENSTNRHNLGIDAPESVSQQNNDYYQTQNL